MYLYKIIFFSNHGAQYSMWWYYWKDTEKRRINRPPHMTCSVGVCRQKVNGCRQDSLKVLEHVKIHKPLESPVSTLKGVFRDSKDVELRFKKEELRKVEERLRLVFIEFYQKLRLSKLFRWNIVISLFLGYLLSLYWIVIALLWRDQLYEPLSPFKDFEEIWKGQTSAPNC